MEMDMEKWHVCNWKLVPRSSAKGSLKRRYLSFNGFSRESIKLDRAYASCISLLAAITRSCFGLIFIRYEFSRNLRSS